MDVIEHYFKNHIFEEYTDSHLLLEAKLGGIPTLDTLFTIDSKRNNKKTFIALVDKNELVDHTNKILKIKNKKLWDQMKAELQAAGSKQDLDGWGGKKGKINQLFGVTLGSIGKAYNNLSTVKGGKKVTGEDWESMITVALALQRKPRSDLAKGEYAAEWKRVTTKGFWGSKDLREVAFALANSFRTNGINELKQIGSGTGGAAVSSEWSDIFAKVGRDRANKTPKTDVLGGGGKRISLKKKGGSQLMSAKRVEAYATLEVAFQKFATEHSAELKTVFNTLKTGVLDTAESGYKGPIDAFKKRVKDLEEDDSEDAKKELESLQDQIENIDQAEKDGAIITTNLNQEFKNNKALKQEFVFEAATGAVKFGDSSESRADTLVEFDPGSKKITQNFSIKKSSDVSDLASKTHFYASFKTSSGATPYIALRGNVRDSEGSVEASVERLLKEGGIDKVLKESNGNVIPTFSTIMREAFNIHEGGKMLLCENFEQLNEWEWLDKLKSAASTGFENVKGGFKKLKDKAVETLSNIWTWVKESVTKAFNWIIKQGKKAMGFLLKFFGITVDKVKFTSEI